MVHGNLYDLNLTSTNLQVNDINLLGPLVHLGRTLTI